MICFKFCLQVISLCEKIFPVGIQTEGLLCEHGVFNGHILCDLRKRDIIALLFHALVDSLGGMLHELVGLVIVKLLVCGHFCFELIYLLGKFIHAPLCF